MWICAIKRFDPYKYVVLVPIRFSICFVSIKMYKLQLTNNNTIPWTFFFPNLGAHISMEKPSIDKCKAKWSTFI